MSQKLPVRLALSALLFAPLVAHAQMHKVAPPEVVTRAIGVYEFTGDLAKPSAARIIPVTIFIDGHLEDAGTYLTRPMPLALQTGVIYSIEQAGKSIGTVTLQYARKVLPAGSSADVAAMGDWDGYGSFVPPAKPKPSNLSASVKIAPIDGEDANSDDERPHFTGKQPGDGNTSVPAAAPSTTPASTTPAPPDDPDRPHLNKRADTPAPAATTDTDNPPEDPDRPTLKHRDLPPDEPEQKGKKSKKQSDSAVLPMATSLNEDPDRPTLKRGKTSGVATPTELQGIPQDLHQIVAVSDASTRDPHLFTRVWETHLEHDQVQAKLGALAQPLIAKYESDNKLTAPAITVLPVTDVPKPKLHTSAAAKGKSTKATAPPAILLDEESISAFELTYGGMPTFVYTAQSAITVGGPVYVTLVAQRLPSGEMQLSLATVTDAAHLDRTPWMRFIDAVDPDGAHRASLLFELRAQSSRQFALYRLITAHAEQQFLTSNTQ